MSEAAPTPASGKRCLQAPRTAPPRRARCCHFTTLLRPMGACRAGEFPLVNSGVTRSAPRGAQRAPTVGPGPLRAGTAPADRGPWALGPDHRVSFTEVQTHGQPWGALGGPGQSCPLPLLAWVCTCGGAHVSGCIVKTCREVKGESPLLSRPPPAFPAGPARNSLSPTSHHGSLRP